MLQKVVAVGIGAFVSLAALVVLLAFLFGILVAFAERSAPAPVSFSALLASPLGRWMSVGSLAVIPVSLLLGIFATLRVTRVQRNFLEAALRRLELREQLEALRRSHQADEMHSSPGRDGRL